MTGVEVYEHIHFQKRRLLDLGASWWGRACILREVRKEKKEKIEVAMFARIIADKGTELKLFRAALGVLADLQSQWKMACEFVPGMGVNLYHRSGLSLLTARLGRVGGDEVWRLLRGAGFPRSQESSREKEEAEDNVPVVVFAPGGEVHFRHPHRISRETLFLTGCALKILKQAGMTESIQVNTDDWPEENPDGLSRSSQTC